MNCGIYLIENTINGHLYIGQSTHLIKREQHHFASFVRQDHCNTYLRNASRRWGSKAFTFKVLLYCEPFELTRYEQELVNRLHPKYNLRIDCVDSRKGMKQPNEIKARISKTLTGHPVSEETRRKISESKKGQSHPQSEETRQRISMTEKGKKVSEETRLRMSDAKMGKRPHLTMDDIRHQKSEAQKLRRQKGRVKYDFVET